MLPLKKAALAGCSDPLPQSEREDIRQLPALLKTLGVQTEISPLLLRETPPQPEEKAGELNRFFADPDMDFIFDVSGGDLANTALPFLDFDVIGRSKALYFGFSDLSVIINAILAKTGKPAVNYQIRNLLYEDAAAQRAFFRDKILPGSFSPADLKPRVLRGREMHGKIYGGNIRCVLKLAGTPWWPAIDGGILLLESLGGGVYQMVTALEQYKQLGMFDRVNGVLLGTFTKMEEERFTPTIEELVLSVTPRHIAVAKTEFVGHYPNAKPIRLGETCRIAADTV